MNDQIIRDCVQTERLARGLADYYSRLTQGVQCPDPLPPKERAYMEGRYRQRLQFARIVIQRPRG